MLQHSIGFVPNCHWWKCSVDKYTVLLQNPTCQGKDFFQKAYSHKHCRTWGEERFVDCFGETVLCYRISRSSWFWPPNLTFMFFPLLVSLTAVTFWASEGEVTGGCRRFHSEEFHELYTADQILLRWSSQQEWDRLAMWTVWEQRKMCTGFWWEACKREANLKT